MPCKHNKSTTKARQYHKPVFKFQRKFFRDICPKMFITEDSAVETTSSKVILSPLDKWAPPIPLLSVLGRLEEMITCTSTVYILALLLQSKAAQYFSLLFRGAEDVSPMLKLSFISPKTWQTNETLENTTKLLCDTWIRSPAASSLSCFHGL